MEDEHIQLAEEAGILTITLNRPAKLNAFAGHMRRNLAVALEEAGASTRVRVVVITGAGRAFCAGGDLDAIEELVQRRDMDECERILGSARRVVQTIRQMGKPVIAAVNGPAAGAGCNLALACDLRIASVTATFTQSFARIGFHPDWGGSFFLPRIVAPNIAAELFFLADPIDSARALALGLVNAVVPQEEFAAETRKLAERLRAAPPLVIASAKRAIYLSEKQSLDEMLQYETEAQMRCFASQDAAEGLRALREERPPKFSGR